MFPRVRESIALLIVIFLLPIQLVARGTDREGGVEIDQNIGLGDFLPHGLHVRMLLRDMTADIAMFFKPRHQRGLTRTARSNNTDKGSIAWRLHMCRAGLQPAKASCRATLFEDFASPTY